MQQARRRVAEALMVKTRERIAREKRLTDQGGGRAVRAIAERDAAVTRAERETHPRRSARCAARG